MKSIRSIILPSLIMAVSVMASLSASAAVLLTDTFPGSALDTNKYATEGGAIGDVTQAGGELILKSQAGSGTEWQPRISTKEVLPDNIKIEANIRIVDNTQKNGVGTTWANVNFGWRSNAPTFDGNGASMGIFVQDGSNATDQVKIRRGGDWVAVDAKSFTAELTNGQIINVVQVVNVGAGTSSLTIKDKTSGSTLLTMDSSLVGFGFSTSGYLMLEAYNIGTIAYQDFKVTANGGAGSVLIDDSFESSAINPTYWVTYPSVYAFVAVHDSVATLNGDDPANLAGNFSWLPTKDLFGNIDMQATLKLSNLKRDTDDHLRHGEDFFAIRFRMLSSTQDYYQVAIWPNEGTDPIGDTGIYPPAFALRRADSPTTFTYIDGPYQISPATEGDTMVVNIKANGSSLTAFLGKNTTAGEFPAAVGTNTSLTTGIVQFDSFGLSGIDIEEYTIWDAGTGTLPQTPTPPAAAGKLWNLYE